MSKVKYTTKIISCVTDPENHIQNDLNYTEQNAGPNLCVIFAEILSLKTLFSQVQNDQCQAVGGKDSNKWPRMTEQGEWNTITASILASKLLT